MLSGKYEDMGDIVIHTEWLLKGHHWKLVWHLGAQIDVLPEERPAPVPSTIRFDPGRIDVIMDLGADKKVALSAGFTDEVGNAVPAPTGATLAYTVDDTTIIALTDNGDGTAEAAATGLLGNAVVSLTATLVGGAVVTGDLLISVVPGEAERVTITAGAPEEVTPDV